MGKLILNKTHERALKLYRTICEECGEEAKL